MQSGRAVARVLRLRECGERELHLPMCAIPSFLVLSLACAWLANQDCTSNESDATRIKGATPCFLLAKAQLVEADWVSMKVVNAVIKENNTIIHENQTLSLKAVRDVVITDFYYYVCTV